MEKRSTQCNLKTIAVVDIYYKEHNSDCTKKASDVRENFIKFLELSLIGSFNTRLKKRKATVDIDILSDFIWILDGKLVDDST